MLQEWWGITEEIKKQAQRLTSKGGYRTIVPDLYKGKLGLDAEVLYEVQKHMTAAILLYRPEERVGSVFRGSLSGEFVGELIVRHVESKFHTFNCTCPHADLSRRSRPQIAFSSLKL